MRRLIVIATVVGAALVVLALGTGASGGGGGYKVRAIFDNAVSLVTGEDVKVAGVKVGTIDSLDVTPDKKAAVVLSISDPAFQDFRTDAHCTIRPQSLIGEKFVECTPTQPRPVGAAPAPRLQRIASGAGKGQYLLPVQNTSTPVDIDLVGDILRLPYRQRLALLINELGTGLAGTGQGLNDAIRRADPALQQTDRVLSILANENTVLANLARDSDTVMAPLGAQSRRLADFVVKANTTAQATVERSAALQQDIAKLPEFLRQLTPTATRLGALAEQGTPVLANLRVAAPSVNRVIETLGPFSAAATPALKSLGRAADVGRRALPAARGVVADLRTLGAAARPLGANLAALTASLRDTGGLERILDYVFFQASAINGFDSFGHYLRAALIVNTCSTYTTTPVSGCLAKFDKGGGSSASAASASTGDPSLERVAAILRGMPLAQVLAGIGSPGQATNRRAKEGRTAPAASAPGGGPLTAPVAPAAQPQPSSGLGSAAQGLFDYLFGGSR